MHEKDRAHQVQRAMIRKGGYGPVTPLGPPPQGEPLFVLYPSEPPVGPPDHPQPDAAPDQPPASPESQGP